MWAAEPSFTNEELESIEAPTLLIIGDRGIVTLEYAVEMFRTILVRSSAWFRTPLTGRCPRRRFCRSCTKKPPARSGLETISAR